MTRPDPLPHLAALAAALAEPGQPGQGFAALQAALDALIGHRLFTILLHDAAAGCNARVHSSQPEAYPLGGRKPLADTPWTRHVMHLGQPWIGRDKAAIAANFRDHAVLHALGCDSILNLPVRWGGATIGTLNLSHAAGWYAEADIVVGQLVSGLARPVLLAAQAVMLRADPAA
jgi:hypothetical protein